MRGRAWLKVMVITAALVIGLGWLAARPVPDVPVYDGDLEFQASQAMLYLSELVTRFPRRDYAYPARREAAEWIAAELGQNGLQVYTQEFSEVIAGRRVDGLQNVFAVLPGRISKAILVVAHYDTPPFVREGAADDASGVATMMELARVFSRTNPRWTMIFLASDSEEYGAMWGSYRFLLASGWKDRLAAVVSLDFANMGPMKGIKLRSMGIHQGYTPLWLREMTKAAIARETQAIDVSPVMEWVERSVAVAPTEHGVYLEAGIPAVDLWGVPQDQAWQSRHYHTVHDTLDKVHPATVAHYGRAAERLLRTLQGLEDWPSGEMRYFKLGRRYLPGGAVLLLQLVALLPLLVGTLRARLAAGRGRAGEVWLEVRHLSALFLAGCLGYLALWLSSEKGLMVKYELYPATQKDPVLNAPQLLPLALMAAALIGGYFVFRGALRVRGGVSPAVRRAVALTGLLFLVVAAVLFNGGFAALAFLAPAIYLWPLARTARNRSVRLLNVALALSALVVFAAFVALFSQLYFIGHVWWYILMAAAYGLFRARAVLAFLIAAALFLRFTSAALCRE
ncbi:MAG: M28 family peptidase [Bacillota bacterium]|nr:M28 family peptidase [Bacillota bacterium]